jgi:hypothetical protein
MLSSLFSLQIPPYPVKMANYLIARLDFQTLTGEKAQYTRFYTACLEYRHFC